MNSYIKETLIFVVGAAIGSLATYKLVEEKYKKLSQDEIKSVKNMYAKKSIDLTPIDRNAKKHDWEKDEIVEEPMAHNVTQLYSKRNREDVIDYDKFTANVNKAKPVEPEPFVESEEEGEPVIETTKSDKAPHVISLSDFDSEDEYDKIEYILYDDGVLADDTDEIINPLTLINEDLIALFDESGEDAIYIRNDHLETDYEITRDGHTYSEITGNDPNDNER